VVNEVTQDDVNVLREQIRQLKVTYLLYILGPIFYNVLDAVDYARHH